MVPLFAQLAVVFRCKTSAHGTKFVAKTATLNILPALVLLYIITLICAIFNFDGAGRMFKVSLFATIFIPIILWLYIWMYGKLTNKHTIADFDNMPATKAINEPETERRSGTSDAFQKNTRS